MTTDNSQTASHSLPTGSDLEIKNLSNIRNDEDLQEKISEVQNKKTNSLQQERFVELEKTIHNFLQKQDSDNALKIITK